MSFGTKQGQVKLLTYLRMNIVRLPPAEVRPRPRTLYFIIILSLPRR